MLPKFLYNITSWLKVRCAGVIPIKSINIKALMNCDWLLKHKRVCILPQYVRNSLLASWNC